MNLKQALIWAGDKLKTKTASPIIDTEVLLSFVIKKPKEFLYTHPKTKLSANQLKKFKNLIKRRSKGEPVAYITNAKEFYGLDFYVSKQVLIPRPETELLVEEILKYLKTKNFKPKTIVDIGTGSGCIAVTLAKQLPKTAILATDISKPALQVASKNAKTNKVKIKFFHGNLLTPIRSKRIDIIVANLPYLEKGLAYEPQKAFVAGKHGLDLYKKLFQQIIKYNLKPKFILIEINPRQTNKIKKIITEYLPKSKMEIKKDLAGLDRIVIIAQG